MKKDPMDEMPTMANDDTLPPEQELMDMSGDDVDGYAEGGDPMPEATSTPMEKPALADVVPEANANVEDRIAALENQLRSARDAAAEPPLEGEPPGAPGGMDDSEWAMFKTDYPDIAGPIEKILAMRDQTRETQAAAMHKRIFEEAMDVARPDWRDLRDDPAFGEWMQSNPEQQAAAQVPGVRAALKVLSAYDATRKGNDLAAKRQERLAANTATPSKSSRAPNLSDTLDGWAAT